MVSVLVGVQWCLLLLSWVLVVVWQGQRRWVFVVLW